MRQVYIHADLHSVNTVVYTATTPAKLKRRLQPKPKDNKGQMILDFSLMLYFTATSGQPFYQKVTVKLNQKIVVIILATCSVRIVGSRKYGSSGGGSTVPESCPLTSI